MRRKHENCGQGATEGHCRGLGEVSRRVWKGGYWTVIDTWGGVLVLINSRVIHKLPRETGYWLYCSVNNITVMERDSARLTYCCVNIDPKEEL